jgi:putative acetyltransferase
MMTTTGPTASPARVTIRQEEPADAPAVHELLLTAFDDDVPARLVEGLRGSLADAPELAFVAVVDEQVVGYVKLSWLTVDGSPTFQALNLTPVAVTPAHQGRGIARQLIEHALGVADTATDAPLVVLEGDPAHYHRYGFQRASSAGIGRPSPRIPDVAFQFVPLSRYEPHQHRGDATYPAVFHELGAIGP